MGDTQENAEQGMATVLYIPVLYIEKLKLLNIILI